MFGRHKIIPKGAIAWDNTGNNKAYQSRQVIFVLNPTSIYAHLADSDKDLYKVTGLLPVPAGPAGGRRGGRAGGGGPLPPQPLPPAAQRGGRGGGGAGKKKGQKRGEGRAAGGAGRR